MPSQRPPRASSRSQITIRAMRLDDLDVVVELDARVFGEPRPAYFERRMASLGQGEPTGQAIALVAEASGAVVGLVMGTLVFGEFGFAQVTALVDSIAVHPAYQRRGVGRRLASAFLTESAARGAREVYTLVNWNAWEMLKFFDSMGFSLASTIPLRRTLG